MKYANSIPQESPITADSDRRQTETERQNVQGTRVNVI